MVTSIRRHPWYLISLAVPFSVKSCELTSADQGVMRFVRISCVCTGGGVWPVMSTLATLCNVLFLSRYLKCVKRFLLCVVFSIECVTACGVWDKEAEWAGPVLPEIDLWLSICTHHYILHYTRALKYVSVHLIKIHVVHSESQLCLPWKALLATEHTAALDAFAKLRKATFDMIYLLTAIGLTPSGSSTVHIYTQKIHRTTQRIWIPRTEHR